MSNSNTTNYVLPTHATESKGTLTRAWANLWPLMREQKGDLFLALGAVILSSASNLVTPIIIAHAIDTYIAHKNLEGVLLSVGLLLIIYLAGLFTSYTQTMRMGAVGRGVLFNLRNALFIKLQSLPIAFFNQNKTGDLISRINNDTDKLNQFFTQALMQFFGNAFLILGAGILLVVLHPVLGLATLAPAFGVLIVTQLISGWIKAKNRASLQSLGGLSAEIQESLDNFKVIVAFNRLDYFRAKFKESNDQNYATSIDAGIATNIFIPVYGFASNLGQLIVLSYGLYLIATGDFTIGLLVGYLLYVNSFYAPLRQLASVWSSLQLALASLDRIQDVLAIESDMKIEQNPATGKSDAVLEFKDVSFAYPGGKQVLGEVSFALQKGKTYALVGPTGGGKTTTASLMARLYDPTEGTVFLDGKDIRSYEPEERAKRVGFILQEPFLFTGTVRDNLVYGHPTYMAYTDEQLKEVLETSNLASLVERFDEGLATKITASGTGMSLGQRQIIAFMRAVLREPELLILDEATANIDTVTEQQLEEILAKLPKETTKVIIAHRLNTIQDADEIFFVNGGTLTLAGSMEHAVDLLLHHKRDS